MTENKLNYEVWFIDDGSKDSSWSIVEQLTKNNKEVNGIKFVRNYGKSAALNVAFSHTRGDVVITMDADLQDSPDEVPELARRCAGAVALRYCVLHTAFCVLRPATVQPLLQYRYMIVLPYYYYRNR